jgi:hypothetical protein
MLKWPSEQGLVFLDAIHIDDFHMHVRTSNSAKFGNCEKNTVFALECLLY